MKKIIFITILVCSLFLSLSLASCSNAYSVNTEESQITTSGNQENQARCITNNNPLGEDVSCFM